MLTKTAAVTGAMLFVVLATTSPTDAGQTDGKPLLALWEFDGWTPPTPQRPLGLRFALFEDGRVMFSYDEPANDTWISNNFFTAQISPQESEDLTRTIATILQTQPTTPTSKDHGWTEFYFRDAGTGRELRAEVAGHPCLATGRVFSASAAISGEQAARNGSDRAKLTAALRNACNTLAGFHHSNTQPWLANKFPAPLPES